MGKLINKVTILLVAVVGLFIFFILSSKDAPPNNGSVTSSTKPINPWASSQKPSYRGKIALDEVPPNLTTKALSLLEFLLTSPSSEDVLRSLQSLKECVHATDPTAAATQIVQLLEGGKNVTTGLIFEVGEEGTMARVGTWRAALLDLLGQTDPNLSAQYSLGLLNSRDSLTQEEYALVLRNLGWANFEEKYNQTLKDGFIYMLENPEWRTNPQIPFYEAFDVAVATQLDYKMAEVLQTAEDPSLQRAAFIALDRMMLKDPLQVGKNFLEASHPINILPVQRASLLSRLDMRDPQQEQLLYRYLTQSNLGDEEVEYFCEIFPNLNSIDSHRLITGWEEGRGIAQMENMRQASMVTLSRFIPILPASKSKYLEKTLERLSLENN